MGTGIMKKHNNIFYLLGQGVKSTFKHGFMSFAAVCITVACLVIVNSFVLICFNLDHMVAQLQQDMEMLVIVEETVSEQEAKHLGSQINLIENVREARFRSNEDSFKDYIQDYDKDIFEGVEAGFMRHQYIVNMEDISLLTETKREIEAIPGIAKVNVDENLANSLVQTRSILYVATAGIAVVLLAVSLIIISNTIKLAMMDRKEEIAIMKMVGATNGFIQLPFLAEGFLLGLFGSVFSFFIEWGLYELLCRAILSTKAEFIAFQPFDVFMIPLAIFCGVAGFFIGIFGSLMSIRRFLKV